MKIGDVIVGETYGAVERPGERSRYSKSEPREARVLEILVVEEKVWNQYTHKQDVKKVRRVKVELASEPNYGRSRYGIDALPKGATTTIQARQLVAPWAQLAPQIRQKAEQEAKRTKARDAMQARLDKLIGKDKEWVAADIYSGKVQLSARLTGASLEKLVALAETGKQVT